MQKNKIWAHSAGHLSPPASTDSISSRKKFCNLEVVFSHCPQVNKELAYEPASVYLIDKI